MFKCNQCPSEFDRKYNLLRHYKTHVGVRFFCTDRTREFTDRSNLKRHLKLIHGM